jgi:hypothetical protein
VEALVPAGVPSAGLLSSVVGSSASV